MSHGTRAGVIILTALAAICSLGILAFAVSRLLVNRFKKLNMQQFPHSTFKTYFSAIHTFNRIQTPAQPIIKATVATPPVQAHVATTSTPLVVTVPVATNPPIPLTQPPQKPLLPPVNSEAEPNKGISKTLTPPPASVPVQTSQPVPTPAAIAIAPPPPKSSLPLIASELNPKKGIPTTLTSPPAPVPAPQLASAPNLSAPSTTGSSKPSPTSAPTPAAKAPPTPAATKKAQSIEDKMKHFYSDTNVGASSIFSKTSPDEYNIVLRDFITKRLESLGKVCGESEENGNCFLHAFCQALTVLGTANQNVQTLSIPSARFNCGFILSQYDWLEDWFKNNKRLTRDTINEYSNKVTSWASDVLPSYPTREGRILCESKKLNLKIYHAEILGMNASKANELRGNKSKLEEFLNPPKGTMGPDPFVFHEDPTQSITVPGATSTIEIVMFPHPKFKYFYFPVFSRQDLDNIQVPEGSKRTPVVPTITMSGGTTHINANTVSITGDGWHIS